MAGAALTLCGAVSLVAQSFAAGGKPVEAPRAGSGIAAEATTAATVAPAGLHRHGDVAAQDAEAALPPLIARDEEIALAESAGPPSVAKDATIYILERGKGFTVAREGKNGFVCMVNRERADTLEPECFDPEGVASIVPATLERAKLREQGTAPAEISKRIAEGYASGLYRAPRRGGVTYMLSAKNRVFAGKSVISYPPHVMIMAPYVKNSDIGADFKNPMMPWVLGEGTPNAYIMVVTRDWPAKTAPAQSAQ